MIRGPFRRWSIGGDRSRLRQHAVQLSIALGVCATLALSQSMSMLVSAAETSRPLAMTAGQGGPARSLAWSSDGHAIALTTGDGAIKLWDAIDGRPLRSLGESGRGATSIAFSPDGRTIATAYRSRAIDIWDASLGQVARALDDSADDIHAISYSPDGRTIAAGSAKSIKLWDSSTGRLARTFEEPGRWVVSVGKLVWMPRWAAKAIVALTYANDGGTIASISAESKTIKIWNASSGRFLRALEGHNGTVLAIVYSPDGRTIASASDDRTIKIWDTITGRTLRTFEMFKKPAMAMSFSRDGRMLASASSDEGTIDIWSVSAGRMLRTIGEKGAAITCLAYSPDGSRIAVGYEDATMRVWDATETTAPAPSGAADLAAPAAGGAAAPADRRPTPSDLQKAAPTPTLSASVEAKSGQSSPEASEQAVMSPSPPLAVGGKSNHTSIDASPSLSAAPTASSPVEVKPVYNAPDRRRVALVIGNSAYRRAPLDNPSLDADTVGASLAKVGFSVTVKKDLDLESFEQAIKDFAEETKGADVALFYFAGHGFSVDIDGVQTNMLMTTSANFAAKSAIGLRQGGEPLEHVEETIIGRARATLIFVDACRTVPHLAVRGAADHGFGNFDPNAFDGAYVVLSTRVGRPALDGQIGKGSPFARAFAAIVQTPGLRIEDVYYRIRNRVKTETAGEQIPDAIRSDLPEGGVVLMSDKQP